MKNSKNLLTILVAEDDPDDRLLINDALEEAGVCNKVHYVEDGQELIDYLRLQGKYYLKKHLPRPGIIILDLNMPKKNGQDALREIKSDPKLKRIPVIVMTTSKRIEDIGAMYDMGANSYINKPTDFVNFVTILKVLSRYWFEIVELPSS